MQDRAFSVWPEPLGFAAVNDAELTRRFGDIVRQEYESVGIRESLAPQADLATEPRWARANGTFGEDAGIAKRMTEAYVAGVQNGADGLNSGSVTAVVKHWAVKQQKSDLPHDSQSTLFPFGFGLHYEVAK